ncbi:MAG TPA: (d)CMP kinase [Candidatus Saccharimonadia bacterium]|nr:(d)CMP kinase [Candidatus Saccharimonadia bacterium]
MAFQVAIDGPVAAGKSTTARLVASKLGFLYVDTGAMYRATALLAKRKGVNLDNESAVAKVVAESKIELRQPVKGEDDGRKVTVLLDGEDVSWEIRTEETSRGASLISQYALVRQELVKRQQEIAKGEDVVMEGRDITYRVLPDAQLKIYLDASMETRVDRWYNSFLVRGVQITKERARDDVAKRDDRDMHRKVDPLKIVKGAWVLDTTDLTIEQVVAQIVDKVHQLQKKQ